ncbi:hypothetical protein, partial [Campylobacter geochelonis]|uniref:hypothetical protein n=1 Tax=Campylobacter geochelonis TaxID=1780362 RepID=UPI001A9718B1
NKYLKHIIFVTAWMCGWMTVDPNEDVFTKIIVAGFLLIIFYPLSYAFYWLIYKTIILFRKILKP